MFDSIFHESPTAQVHIGSIGWEGEELWYELGDDTNDGHTLVRVQLFEGRDPTTPLSNRAQGTRILCHLTSGMVRIPPKDARCYVIIPAGMEQAPGAGLIVGVVEPTPNRAGNVKPDEKIIVGPEGSAGRVVLKSDGTVALVTGVGNDENGGTVMLTVSPTGMRFYSPYGTFSFDATGFHLKTKAGPRIDMGGFSVPGLPDSITGAITGYCNITSPVIKANGAVVYLGAGPNYGTALFQPTSAMAIPVPVTSGPTSQTCSVRLSYP